MEVINNLNTRQSKKRPPWTVTLFHNLRPLPFHQRLVLTQTLLRKGFPCSPSQRFNPTPSCGPLRMEPIAPIAAIDISDILDNSTIR